MLVIRPERLADVAAREALLDHCFGAARFEKASQRLRDGFRPAAGLAFVATDRACLVGTVRLWNVSAGPACPALLLGPLAVDSGRRGRGIGAALMRHALGEAARLGHAAVLLVGDAPYYGRFGFAAGLAAGLEMPGTCESGRLLSLELVPGALAHAGGLIAPAGRREARPTHAGRRGLAASRLPQAA